MKKIASCYVRYDTVDHKFVRTVRGDPDALPLKFYVDWKDNFLVLEPPSLLSSIQTHIVNMKLKLNHFEHRFLGKISSSTEFNEIINQFKYYFLNILEKIHFCQNCDKRYAVEKNTYCFNCMITSSIKFKPPPEL